MDIWLLHYEKYTAERLHEYVVFLDEEPSNDEIEGWQISGYEIVSCTHLETTNCTDFPGDVPILECLHKR